MSHSEAGSHPSGRVEEEREVSWGCSLGESWSRLEETGLIDTLTLEEFQKQQGTLGSLYFLRQ